MKEHPLYLLGLAGATALLLLLVARAVQSLLFRTEGGSPNSIPPPSLPPPSGPGAGAGGGRPPRSVRGSSMLTAANILHAGRYFGVFAVAEAAVRGSVGKDTPILTDVLWIVVFGLVGLLLLEVTGRLGIHLLLRSKLPTEIARGNAAAALASGAHYVATALIISRSLSGSGLKDLGVSLAFFVIGQLTLHLFVILFRAVTSYDDDTEILGGNLAAAVSYGGIAIAFALIIGRAADGTFVSWVQSVKEYGISLTVAISLYPVRQLLVQILMLGGGFKLSGGKIDEAIANNRDVGVSALEAATYVATAVLLNVTHH